MYFDKTKHFLNDKLKNRMPYKMFEFQYYFSYHWELAESE
jgi:hypothetical protein